MRVRELLHTVRRAIWWGVRLAASTLVTAVASAAERVTYRKHEVAVVGLLAASVVGGFAVEQWHRRAPAVLERLEAERPRLGAPAQPPPRRPTSTPRGPRARPPSAPPPAPPPQAPLPQAPRTDAGSSPETPLDLNRATATELMRLPGIGARLAGRILARRETLGGRFGTAEDLATVPGIGGRRVAVLRPLVTVGSGAATERAGPATERAGPEMPEPEPREPP